MQFPPPGDLPDQWMEPGSLTLQADSLPSEPPGKPLSLYLVIIYLTENFKKSTKNLCIGFSRFP